MLNQSEVAFPLMFGSLVVLLCITSTLGVEYTFQSSNLTSVPVIHADATVLDLEDNLITRIEMTSFTGLSAIQEIDLDSNLIYYIDDEAFSSCSALEMITIESNQLLILTPYGKITGNLVYLKLLSNPLLHVPEEYFFLYTRLESLRMDMCGLTHVPAFPDGSPLGRLTMSKNPVETVSDLSRLPSLVYISMDTSNVICDWKLCWGLFEPFNLSGRDPYVSHHSGRSYGPRDDLQLDTMECWNPRNWNGKLFKEITPLELQCYKNPTYVDRFIQVFGHQAGEKGVNFTPTWSMPIYTTPLQENYTVRSSGECAYHCSHASGCVGFYVTTEWGLICQLLAAYK